jgi:hypothetical protein
MALLSFLRRFRRDASPSAAPSSKLSNAADAVSETRTGNVVHGDVAPEQPDGIANIVAAANDALFVDRSNEDRVLGNSKSGYRRSK